MWGDRRKKSKKKSTKKRSDGESGLGTFADSAYWRIFDKDDQASHEPDNARFKTVRAPTIWEADAKFVPVKYGFSKYKFDIPVLGAVFERVSRWENGMSKKKKNGKVEMESNTIESGCVDPKLIAKYGLTKDTRTEQYAEILLPMNKNMQGAKEIYSFRQLKYWTNLKASLADAGKDGSCYQDFKDFSTNEIRQGFGLYVVQGLCHSPRVELKFRSQQQYKVHGNDFVYISFDRGG